MTAKAEKPRAPPKEAERLAHAIDNLIMARVMQMHSPSSGSEAGDNQRKELADELKRLL